MTHVVYNKGGRDVFKFIAVAAKYTCSLDEETLQEIRYDRGEVDSLLIHLGPIKLVQLGQLVARHSDLLETIYDRRSINRCGRFCVEMGEVRGLQFPFDAQGQRGRDEERQVQVWVHIEEIQREVQERSKVAPAARLGHGPEVEYERTMQSREQR